MRQYQDIINKLPDGVLITYTDRNQDSVVSVNDTLRQWLHLNPTIPPSCGEIRETEEAKDNLRLVKTEDGRSSLLELVQGPPTGPIRLRFPTAGSGEPRVAEATSGVVQLEDKEARLTVVRDLTSWEELTKERLEKKYVRMLIASVTHEIRNPLNIEMGMLDMISELKEWEYIAPYVEIAKKNIKLLTYLVNDVYDLLQPSNATYVLNKSSFSLRLLLYECEDLLRHQLEAKKLDFRLDIDPKMPNDVVTDKERYRRILLNLLMNAVKYTTRGMITVTVKRHLDDCFATTVADTGIGMSPDTLGKLFKFCCPTADAEQAANPQGALDT